MHELKLTARAGIMIFEALEQNTIRQGSDRLLVVLREFPAVLESFYHRLHTLVEDT